MKKIALLWYDLHLYRIDGRIESLIEKGHKVEIFTEEKGLLSLIEKDPNCFDVVVTEMVLQGPGDEFQFFGKRNGLLDDCAKLLADELDSRKFTGKIVILTDWDHVERLFSGVKKSPRFAKVITASQGEAAFLKAMDEVLA
jgi:hypothetical protein